jgi:hypothetical protein
MLTELRAALRNFWVCLFLALLMAILCMGEVSLGRTGWAWFDGLLALMWLNDARRAMNRDKEETEDV